MLYGALLAWRQNDLKAMVAYSSISHMGVVLLGIATLSEAGLLGAVIQMTAHGLVAGALFLLVGLLYERTHTRNIQNYSSLIEIMPRFACFMTIALFASIGLPGSLGFIAELHTLLGGMQQWGWLWLFFGCGFLINAAYAIRTISLLFTGLAKPAMQPIPDLTRTELLAASALTAGILLFGVWPAPLIELSRATLSVLNDAMQLRGL
jgi:NADH-quinone oxidoreductase subunit M